VLSKGCGRECSRFFLQFLVLLVILGLPWLREASLQSFPLSPHGFFPVSVSAVF
jgi:hypothetical protein